MTNPWLITSPMSAFTLSRGYIESKLLEQIPVHRGQWQSTDVSGSSNHSTYEICPLLFTYDMPPTLSLAQTYIKPDLPWAEDHFIERVCGTPLNPPPSEKDWPYHGVEHGKHQDDDGKFDHTYPERFWPRSAGDYWPRFKLPTTGIRFPYGTLQNVVRQLQLNSWTRQAYLPVWFPEDTGATAQKHDVSREIRVPCTLGYQFMRRNQFFDVNYFIRSCDIYRHFTNDVYMAVRLGQWVFDQMETEDMHLGKLNMFISNMHMFRGDAWRYQ